MGADPVTRQRVDIIAEDEQRRDCQLIATITGAPILGEVNDIRIVIKIASLLELQFD
jgi:hypothetical protein